MCPLKAYTRKLDLEYIFNTLLLCLFVVCFLFLGFIFLFSSLISLTYEAAIKFGKALESADRGTLFKASVKELAHPLGIMPSFMAKPSANLPGCSGHLHQNLVNLSDNKNVFLDEYLISKERKQNKRNLTRK